MIGSIILIDYHQINNSNKKQIHCSTPYYVLYRGKFGVCKLGQGEIELKRTAIRENKG